MSQGSKLSEGISNLRLSSEVINISHEDQTGGLTITNSHQSYSLLFKIKTKIEKIFEVKPARGFLRPGEKAVITFKPFSKLQKEEEMIKYEKTLQFLLQGVNLKSLEITKEQQENIWRSIKEKKADVGLGYCSVKIGINMTGMVVAKEFVAPYTNYESKIQNRFSSNVKSEKSAISSDDISTNRFSESAKQVIKNEADLSQKYAQLKSEHVALEKQREKLFSIRDSGKSSGNATAFKLIVIFIICFLAGNFLKEFLQPTTQIPVEPEKHWFSSLFG